MSNTSCLYILFVISCLANVHPSGSPEFTRHGRARSQIRAVNLHWQIPNHGHCTIKGSSPNESQHIKRPDKFKTQDHVTLFSQLTHDYLE